MREALLLLVCLASLGLLSSHPTLHASKNVERSRSKRQLSEVVRLYNEMVEENRVERKEALDKIRVILSRVFVSNNATTTAATPSNNGTSSSDDDDVTTPKPQMKIDRVMLLANLRRNLRGIGRLFMRELNAALSNAKKS
ncbi:uncharacterized protein LOC132203110 isoform X2 [Neocloeon triangulifer]|uniref:uncharacterized protein LOC132203110 isoform X2 n=1 Tax=Neocloeon triangulifer TaxID=2078957 RepID=UPI00286F168F|nr:uncharacterized protein LOC132203110 isoform X2 [Neocloeon triangulifer]